MWRGEDGWRGHTVGATGAGARLGGTLAPFRGRSSGTAAAGPAGALKECGWMWTVEARGGEQEF